MFVIMHADLDSFYASVEQRDDPRLRGKPVLVGGGVVLAASYEAKAFGVRTPMSGAAARALCPGSIVVPPRMDAYLEASKAVFEIFRDTTPLVEGISVDEAFLDVSGLGKIRGTPVEVAARLRREVKDKVGLPITVGIATTKFLAKVASAVGKPDGLLLVEPGRELEFLHPLKIERLWGVGKVTAEKLHAFDIVTVGDIASQSEASIISILGKGAGHHLYSLAHNRDPRRVQTYRGRSSIGAQHALGRGRKSMRDIETSLIALVDRVTQRMRAAERTGRTVVLRLRFDDFTKVTRSHTLHRATADTQDILDAALSLLRDAGSLIADRGITLVGVTVGNIERSGAEQLELQFEQPQDAPSASALDLALDGVHTKFGKKALTRGVMLGRATDLSVPLLPD